MHRRHVLQASVNSLFTFGTAAPALVGLHGTSQAQSPQPAYPRQPMRLLAAYQPDDLPQKLAVYLAKYLTERLRNQVSFDAAIGNNVATVVAQLQQAGAASDGHTLLVGDSALMSLQDLVYKDPGFRPKLDLVPCALVGRAPLVLAVHTSVPANTMAEFARWVQSGTGAALGTPGGASVSHFAALALQSALWPGAALRPVAGGAAALAELSAGNSKALLASYAALAPLAATRKVKLLATTALPAPAGSVPLPLTGSLRLPSLLELSPNMAFYTHLGLFAPAFTPAQALARIGLEVGFMPTLAEPRAALIAMGIEPLPMDAGTYYKLALADSARMAAIAKAAGLAPQ